MGTSFDEIERAEIDEIEIKQEEVLDREEPKNKEINETFNSFAASPQNTEEIKKEFNTNIDRLILSETPIRKSSLRQKEKQNACSKNLKSIKKIVKSKGKRAKSNLSHQSKFTCKICDKSFSLVSNLNRHQMVHSNYRAHGCKFCSKKFNRTDILKRHLLIHLNKVKKSKCRKK